MNDNKKLQMIRQSCDDNAGRVGIFKFKDGSIEAIQWIDSEQDINEPVKQIMLKSNIKLYTYTHFNDLLKYAVKNKQKYQYDQEQDIESVII